MSPTSATKRSSSATDLTPFPRAAGWPRHARESAHLRQHRTMADEERVSFSLTGHESLVLFDPLHRWGTRSMRCLKRSISDVIYRQLIADAQRAANTDPEAGPWRGRRGDPDIHRGRPAPHIDTSDQPLPGPAMPTLRSTSTSRQTHPNKHLAATG